MPKSTRADRAVSPEVGPTPPSTPMKMTRYPKRKREQVNYHISGDEAEEEEDLEERPKPKRMKVVKPEEPKAFRFMDLPPELRLCIYRVALQDPCGGLYLRREGFKRGLLRYRVQHCPPWWCYTFYKGSGHDGFQHSGRIDTSAGQATMKLREWNHNMTDDQQRSFYHLRPALLAASKTVYAEALPVLYGQPLVFSDCEVMHDMLMTIGKDAFNEIHDVRVIRWCGGGTRRSKNLPGLQLLKDATNLRRLHIDCLVGWESSWTDAYKMPQNEADYDAEYARKFAKRLYRESFVLLRALRRRRRSGSESWIDVLDLHRENFCPIKPFLGNKFNGGVWTVDRELRVREVFLEELEALLDRNA